MDSIVKIGTREKIEGIISSVLCISLADAKKVFDFLSATYPENTSEFGRIYLSTNSGQELVFGDGQYYINLPKCIVMAVALLLDITLTRGAVLGLCAMLGIQTQVFYNMNQHNGDVCLLREYMRNEGSLDVNKYFYLAGNECVNNDLACEYRSSEGICCIQNEKIENILANFSDAKIAFTG